jgi:hypothetical protein
MSEEADVMEFLSHGLRLRARASEGYSVYVASFGALPENL